MKVLRLTIVLFLIVGGPLSASAQPQSKTYSETRKLLFKMERPHGDKILKKLFEEGETRKSDLIQALYDPDQKVSLNAQSVILYLADPQALSALEARLVLKNLYPNSKGVWGKQVAFSYGYDRREGQEN